MNAYVEECRREWSRLGVPDGLADEMATDLEADLAEAEADGVSAAEILGESDPRGFAAAWAGERGLVSAKPPEKKSRKRLWIGLAVGVLVLAVFSGILAGGLLATTSVHTSAGPPVRVSGIPLPVRVPNVVGMKACKAVRTVAQSGVDDWRIAGHEHGYTCNQIVVGQSPVGHVVRRHDRPVIVTLRLGRT